MQVTTIAEYYAEVLSKVPASADMRVNGAQCTWDGEALELTFCNVRVVPGEFYLSDVRINGMTVTEFFAVAA